MMAKRIFLHIGLIAALLVATKAVAAAAEAGARPEGKAGCCPRNGDIARWHKLADRLYAQFKPVAAVKELEKILQVDSRDFEALVKMARAYIDIGDMIGENGDDWRERKRKEYATAEGYARKAIEVDPYSTWGHFWLAASLGNAAMVSPIARQLELADEIRSRIERALELDPNNGFAYHAYGVWHRKIAEIGAASRVVASVVYGQSVPSGSLERSVEYLKKAVKLNPTVIVSRLELARSHIAREEWEAARLLLESVAHLPIQFSDDAKHKRRAEELLAEIKSR